jgi:hypothetical protein
MKEEQLWRHFEGNADEEDALEILNWLDRSNENREFFIDLKKAYVERNFFRG